MAGMTNRGKKLRDDVFFRGATPPTKFYFGLCTSAVAPSPDTNVLSDLTEVAAANGYTAGGIEVARNTTDFPTLTEDDTNDRAEVLLKDLGFTASGGTLPSTGGARYAVLLTDEATPANRQVVIYWDLGADRVVSSGQTMTLQGFGLRDTE